VKKERYRGGRSPAPAAPKQDTLDRWHAGEGMMNQASIEAADAEQSEVGR